MDSALKRKRRLLLGAAAVVIAFLAILYLLGSVLITLGLSLVIAYALFPLIRLLERGMPWRERRPGLSRSISVSAVLLTGLGIIAAGFAVATASIIREGQNFIESFPQLINSALSAIEIWIVDYNRMVPENVRAQVEEWLGNAGELLGGAAWNIASGTFGAITGSFAFIIALATAPVLIFYLMKDSTSIQEACYAPFPASIRPHLRDVVKIADRTVGGYIRGQLLLGLIVGLIVGIALLLLGVPFALVLGLVAGLTELIPIIGPWIGGAVGVIVTLATEPDKVLWVILIYLIVQLAENTLLVPRIQAGALNMHPIAIILVITIGSQYFGLWGVILGPPLVAMVKDGIIYFAQEWNRAGAPEDIASDSDEALAEGVVEAAEGKEPQGASQAP